MSPTHTGCFIFMYVRMTHSSFTIDACRMRVVRLGGLGCPDDKAIFRPRWPGVSPIVPPLDTGGLLPLRLSVDGVGVTAALQCGADLVVQSAHKTLSSLTQSAFLHLGQGESDTNCNLKRNQRGYVQYVLSVYPTTRCCSGNEPRLSNTTTNKDRKQY